MSRPANSFLDHDFGGSDEEEEDEEFNPAPPVESDNEGDGDGDDAEQNDEAGSEGARGRSQSGSPRAGAGQVGDDDEDMKSARAEGENAGDEGEGEPEGGEEQEKEEDDEDEEGGEQDRQGGGDDDEEDEEEEEEEEEEVGRPRKRRRGGLNAFFEEEAEVDEEDDAEEEGEEDMVNDFVTEDHPDDLAALPAGAETDDRRHRELDRQREVEATMDAEKQAQAFKERYGRNRAAPSDLVVVPKRLLLPSVDDPSIWAVKCRPGKEREIVFNLMKRMEERPPGSRKPLRIMSAFERGGTMSGYVYVEARKQADVMEALDGLSNAYIRSKMILIPVKEMPDLLRVTKSEQLNPGDWVRIKRGRYQGDLAQIEEVETNGLDVTVRLVPRLDYGLHEDSGPMNGGDSKRKRPGGNTTLTRPPQRLFSEAEAKKKHGRNLTSSTRMGGRSWTYFGDTYVDGFLIKDMKVPHLLTKNVNPQLDEVTKFAKGADDGTANLDLAALANTIKNSVAEDSYLPGDTVEVYEGEQKGVVGKTISTRGDIISVEVTEGELSGQKMDVPIKGLRKRFREGDHVKVIGGSRFRDELGMVVRIKDDRVTVLTDMSMQEITVFSKDLREADDAGVDGKLGVYDVHDVVQLDQTTVGTILKLDRGSMRILDQNGSVRTMLPSQVISKIEPRRNAVTTDRNGSEIKAGDLVREVTGEQRAGTIYHIHRAFLFCRSKIDGDNSGIIVTRAANVVTVATSGPKLGGRSAPDLSKMNPALENNSMNGTGMPPPRTYGRDRLVGKTVTVRRGGLKGLLGIVKSTTDELARVEMHALSKAVMVEKDNLMVRDPVTGQPIDINRPGGGRGYGRGGGGRTPMSAAPPGQQSHWQGGRTPVAAGDSNRTPAWNAGSARTPAWGNATTKAGGAHTPGWRSGAGSNAGNRTSYGGGGLTAYGGSGSGPGSGLGARTPAWASGSKTPHDMGSGFGNSGSTNSGFDQFMSGSRTPGHGGGGLAAGSRTPAWGPSSNTSGNSGSRSYDAPTPGGEYSAPTPGSYGAGPAAAPTPGASGQTPRAWAESAPTPGAANAPTPGAGYPPKRMPGGGGGGAYDAPTPGAGGRPYDAPTPAAGTGMAATPGAGAMDDGGPRYEDTPSP